MSDKPQTDSEVAHGGDGYMLARNLSASARLHFQFFSWKDTFGFNIHPSIPLPNDENYIAELATGTGIWLIDVSRAQRKAHLHGFDISTEQFPHKEWLPRNITLRAWNAFEDILADTAEKYDLIHIRLFGIALQSGDTRPVLRKVFEMLKPGGHIQWDELNEAHGSIRTISPSVKAPALEQLLHDSEARLKHDWPLHLAESAKEVGFEEARLYHFEDKPEMSKVTSEVAMLFFQEYTSRLESSGQTEAAAKYGDILRRANQEILEGSNMDVPKIVCVARKPKCTQETKPGEKEDNSGDPDFWYAKDIGSRLTPVAKDLFQTWSGLEGDELMAHIYKIRDLAWSLAPYPCVGSFDFISPSLAELPPYNSIVAMGRTEGATILDLGCAFGQNLRILAAAGFPIENMYAADIKSELWELGFDLFGDRDKMKATFLEADILDVGKGSPLQQFSNKMDIIYASNVLHLFDWDKQVIAMKTLVNVSKPGAMVVGRQIGIRRAEIRQRPWGTIFVHDVNTFREIWRLVGMETRTVWNVDVVLFDPGNEKMLMIDTTKNYWIDFVATREQ